MCVHVRVHREKNTDTYVSVVDGMRAKEREGREEQREREEIPRIQAHNDITVIKLSTCF